MMVLFAQMLTIVGFAALALSMPRHYRDILGRVPKSRVERAMRWAGWSLLGAGLSAAVASSGLAFGIILWAGLVTVAALFVAIMLAYREIWWQQ